MEQRLIRGEKSFSSLKVFVVHIIEGFGRGWVHFNGHPGVYILGAHFPELPCICYIKCRINIALAFEVVNSFGQSGAV